MDANVAKGVSAVVNDLIRQIELDCKLSTPETSQDDPLINLKQEYSKYLEGNDKLSSKKFLKAAKGLKPSTSNKPKSKLSNGETNYLGEALFQLSKMADETLTSKSLEKEIQQVDEKLNQLLRMKEERVSLKQGDIDKVAREMKELQTQSEDTIKKLQIKSKQKKEAIKEEHDRRMFQLQADLERAQREIGEMQEKTRDEELALRKKREKIETEFEAWKSKYASDVGEKQAEVDAWKALFGGEQSKFDQLSEKYTALHNEWKKLQELKDREERERLEKEEKKKVETKSAVRIQSQWRGYQTRKQLKQVAPPPKSKPATKKK